MIESITTIFQAALDIWTFADQYRATIKGSNINNKERAILTGIAIGLNSTIKIAEGRCQSLRVNLFSSSLLIGNKKLPPCPTIFFANNQGILQVYYFIHKNLPSVYREPELISVVQQPSGTIIYYR
jgi:hypothetical protein